MMSLTRVLQLQVPQLQQFDTSAHSSTMQRPCQHQHRQRGSTRRADTQVCRARRSSLAQQLKELREEDTAVEQEPELPEGASSMSYSMSDSMRAPRTHGS
jgi:hypothetical protein